jgi:hypothetical protein
MEYLLTLAAVIEAGAGLGMVVLPSLLATLLLGSSLDTPVALTVARVAGVGLLALGIACWLARHDGQSRAARGLVGALVVYNAGVFVVLAYAGMASGLPGIGLWPVVGVHAGMTVWASWVCSINRRCLRHPRRSPELDQRAIDTSRGLRYQRR